MSSSPQSPAAPADTSTNQLLHVAWDRQNAYSKNASRYQSRFVFLRGLLAVLSVLVVVLSVIEGRLAADTTSELWVGRVLLLLPILITALLAFSVKFDRGQNWILLRGNAESLKMEIYYYRTQVGAYETNRDAVLAKRIKLISERIKGSPVHQGALAPYEEENGATKPRMGLVVRLGIILYDSISDALKYVWRLLFQYRESPPRKLKEDKYSDLQDPNQYLVYRLEDQFNWYRSKAKELARQLQWFQTGVYLFGGAGTLLAASDNYKSWVAVTTALTGALTNYLEFKRVEASLVGYNQAADTLYDIRAWWFSLPPAEQAKAKNFQKLVESCEETIRSEHSSWLQDMQDRLSHLYGAPEEEEDDTTTKELPSPTAPSNPNPGNLQV